MLTVFAFVLEKSGAIFDSHLGFKSQLQDSEKNQLCSAAPTPFSTARVKCLLCLGVLEKNKYLPYSVRPPPYRYLAKPLTAVDACLSPPCTVQGC